MEIIVLAAVALALVVTLAVALLKLLIFLVFVPLKVFSALAAGLGPIVLLPLKIVGVLLVLAIVLVGLAALPAAVPLFIAGALLMALAC